MYCLWEQFGLVDDKRDLSLNGMLTFFHRIPAYRAEVQKAISKCKGIGKYFGIYRVFDIFIFSFSSIDPAAVRLLFLNKLVALALCSLCALFTVLLVLFSRSFDGHGLLPIGRDRSNSKKYFAN